MLASYVESCGGPEVIRYGELPAPIPGPTDVLIRVEVVALNHVDLLVRKGRFDPQLPFPRVIGRDVVGRVERCGERVRNFAVGDRVWSNCAGLYGVQGTFAELACVPEERLWSLPPDTDAHTAAASLHGGLTAIVGLDQRARIAAGETLFLTGASGAVGLATLAIARARGARVIASAGNAESARLCREHGAEEIVLYREQNVKEAVRAWAPEGVDLVWEARPAPDLAEDLALLKRDGRLVLIAGTGQEARFQIRDLYINGSTLFGFAVSTLAFSAVRSANQILNDALAAKLFRPRVHAVLPLSQTRQAQELLESGKVDGKLLLEPERR